MTEAESLRSHLRDLAIELVGAGWKTKPEMEWTPDERMAYERWAAKQWAELRDAWKRGERVEVKVQTHQEGQEDKRCRIGEYLRPFTIELDSAKDLRRKEQGPDDPE